MLLIFPLPHGSPEAVDQDDRRACADIQIRDPLIMDEDGFDRHAFYRGTSNVSK